MLTVAQTVRAMVPSVVGAMSCEPAIVPDFRKADLPTLAAVMLAAIAKGRDTSDRVISYLAARGCRHEPDVIRSLLNIFDGRDPHFCLWTRGPTDRYAAIDPTLWMDVE